MHAYVCVIPDDTIYAYMTKSSTYNLAVLTLHKHRVDGG
jgi:hypothetical protein